MGTEHDSVELVPDDVVLPFALAALLAALMGASALFSIPIPFSPAPVTLQTLIVFLAGILLGPVWGGFAIVLYLLAGALGAPVFSQGAAGFGVLVGSPTAGYLWSFPIAAVLIGLIVHRGVERRDLSSVATPVLVASMLLATLLMYGVGSGWYAWLTGVGMVEAIAVMVAPFVVGDLLKVAAAVAIVRTGRLVTDTR